MSLLDKLLVFTELKNDACIKKMSAFLEEDKTQANNDILAQDIYSIITELVQYAEEHGFYGNIWKTYLTDRLVNCENSYSKACEIGGTVSGSLILFVKDDMRIIEKLYSIDLDSLLKSVGLEHLNAITDYKANGVSKIYNSRIRDHICFLAKEMGEAADADKLLDILTAFYTRYGVGRFGLHKAFRIEEKDGGEVEIVPILKIAHVCLDDIIGYEIPKHKLIENTNAFVNKRPANNCLLYGDAGTGKSSSIKAIANEYYEDGIRIIEVYRHQFKLLNNLIAQIKDRNYRFIIYMDDLSFETFETEYKYLKAVIEGGLEKKPDNILIYATSNRRHLVKETESDRDDRDPDMHRSDNMAEKLSLAARFGVSIFFGSPSKKEFDGIVVGLANRNGIDMPKEELLLEANKWVLSHGGYSGRCAQQFIDHLLGIEEKDN